MHSDIHFKEKQHVGYTAHKREKKRAELHQCMEWQLERTDVAAAECGKYKGGRKENKRTEDKNQRDTGGKRMTEEEISRGREVLCQGQEW